MRRVITFFGICGMVLGFALTSADEAVTTSDWIGVPIGTFVPVTFFGVGVRQTKTAIN
jgi:hypothetical protein